MSDPEEGVQLYVDWRCVVKRKRSEYVKAARKPVLNLQRNGRCQDEKGGKGKWWHDTAKLYAYKWVSRFQI